MIGFMGKGRGESQMPTTTTPILPNNYQNGTKFACSNDFVSQKKQISPILQIKAAPPRSLFIEASCGQQTLGWAEVVAESTIESKSGCQQKDAAGPRQGQSEKSQGTLADRILVLQGYFHQEHSLGICAVGAAECGMAMGIHDERAADAFVSRPFAISEVADIAGDGDPEVKFLSDGGWRRR